jgi:hypothetical protein
VADGLVAEQTTSLSAWVGDAVAVDIRKYLSATRWIHKERVDLIVGVALFD